VARFPSRKTSAAVAALLVGCALARLAALHVGRDRRKQAGHSGRLESRWTRVAGLAIHARASIGPARPDVAPVILVHGLGASSRYMIPIAERLAPHFQVHAPDLPGFGLSDKPRRALTLRELADALAAWMEKMGIGQAALIGNSLGNEVIVELALRHPDRVDRLVLQGLTPDPARRSLVQQVWRFFATGLFERSPLAWILAADYVRCGTRRYLRTLGYMLHDPIEAKLPMIRAPVLVVHGGRDRIVSQRWAEEATRLLPRARLAVIPEAAHAINFSYPDAYSDILIPFLSRKPMTSGAPGCPEARSPS